MRRSQCMLAVVVLSIASAETGAHGPYTTRFPRAENPISEGGAWISARAATLDFADVRTEPGFAYGDESGKIKYDDATAVLAGNWGPNQTAEATVRTVNQSETVWEEVELRLRSAFAPHKATGYEINFRCLKTRNAYCEIVRWDGPLGKFTYLKHADGAQYGVANGDVIKATIVGNVITAYVNGVQKIQATDNTFTDGAPGIGFYLEGATGVNRDYGFTSFTATDGSRTVSGLPGTASGY